MMVKLTKFGGSINANDSTRVARICEIKNLKKLRNPTDDYRFMAIALSTCRKHWEKTQWHKLKLHGPSLTSMLSRARLSADHWTLYVASNTREYSPPGRAAVALCHAASFKHQDSLIILKIRDRVNFYASVLQLQPEREQWLITVEKYTIVTTGHNTMWSA